MDNKTKTTLGISLTILCLLVATLFMSSCGRSETENSETVPQSTQDTTVPNNNATEKPIENTNTTSAQDSVISKDDAKKIALDNAKVSEQDAKNVRIDLDYEDGIQIYEVEFDAGDLEYNYDINAKTGEIIKFDKEKD